MTPTDHTQNVSNTTRKQDAKSPKKDTPRAFGPSDVERVRLERENRLSAAFPWAHALSSEERGQFAEELAHHPRDVQNSQLEAVILSWKAIAQGSGAVRKRERRAA